MNKLNKIMTSAALSILFAGQAFAGTLGATSTDDSVVTLEIVDRVQISNVDNITLGAYSGSGVLSGSTEYCVFRNGGDNYQVKLTTDTGSFKVSSIIAGEDIVFTAKIDSDNDASNGATVTYNTATAGMAGATTTNCGTSDNGAIEVSFAQADLLAASSAADYTATMTILVEPI
jgi:hypothetical protein